MADSKPPAPATGATPSTSPAAATPAATYKAPTGANRALKMMGLPDLPRKLPSRNWMIFWTLSASFTAAIIYDKREKKRATARWARAVSHLAKEPIKHPSEMPRKLTIILESPPTDGLRVAQDHFTEYVKPILAASGLDWEFIQGRKEGDVRAAVAERIRRTRDPSASAGAQTADEVVQEIRSRNGTQEYSGMGGDIVIGRNTWKEYVRGVHEGWLGPLVAPEIPVPEPVVSVESTTPAPTPDSAPKEGAEGEDKKPGEDKKAEEEKKPEEKKPERPPQPPPYNSIADYATSSIPMQIPTEFSPSAPVQFPHILGFSNTFIRLGRFLNRRKLADDIGREVASVCLAANREWRQADSTSTDEESAPEQMNALDWEEKNWSKSVWKEAEEEKTSTDSPPKAPEEKIWAKPMVLDSRISTRMRRFEMREDDEARARAITVPEEEVEGWIKGSIRSLYRWAVAEPEPHAAWIDE